MSYDILFVPRRPGQTWGDALDAAEGRDVLTEALRPERRAQWDRIVGVLQDRAGPVEVLVGDDVCEATLPSGLQVSLFPDEASVSFPYTDRADRASFHDLVVDVVGLLEHETGLHAWDAQTDEPFDGRVHDAHGNAATARFEQEGSDRSTTDAMAQRALADSPVPEARPAATGATGADATTDATTDPPATATPATPTTPTAPLPTDAEAELARERTRAVRYLTIGLVVVAGALLLRSQGEPSTLSGLALAVGVADVVIGGWLYRSWLRRSDAARR